MNRIAISFLASLALAILARADPLPSWNDGPAKQSIVSFVERVTTTGSPEYVVPAERIATFDNDGCLWAEQPLYFQLIYMIDRIRALAPDHPEWKNEEPFASILKGEVENALAGGEESLLELAMATHAGITTEAFSESVRDWLTTARHPKTGRPYNEMVYQPMLEVLAYLRANGFKTFIVTGGGIDFVRVFAEEAYDIPPEQVVGSSIKTGYEIRDGKPVLVKLPELNFIDDKEGKPIGIHQHIGRRPIAAFGNSDGDFQMLEWTTLERTPSLGVYIHHDDAAREWAYDRDSHIGKLDRGLDEAPKRGWTVVSMKDDWKTVFSEREATVMSKISLVDSAWRIETIEGTAVIADAEATLRFDTDGRVSGRAGCNAFNGSATIGAGEIVFGPLATTRMACPPALMDQEQRFFKALDQVRAYSIEGDDGLLLNAANAVVLMTLARIDDGSDAVERSGMTRPSSNNQPHDSMNTRNVPSTHSLVDAIEAPLDPPYVIKQVSGVEKNRQLAPGPGNARNSEGDFIQLKDGRILFIYSHFTGGGSDHAAGHLAGRFSSDGGRTWSRKDVLIQKRSGAFNDMSVSLLRLQDGSIALFYMHKNSLIDCRPMIRISTDEARSWGDPVACITDEIGYYVLNNDRVIQLGDGRLIMAVALHNLPHYTEPDWKGHIMCYLSDDSGATWRRNQTVLTPVDADGKRLIAQEPGLVELKDGRLMMFIRSDAGSQLISYSEDRGETWSAARPSTIISPVSPATIERIPSTGDLLLAWNDHEGVDEQQKDKRTPFRVAISRDEGQTWESRRTLEDDPNGWYCYTAMDFIDGYVLLGHCAGDRRTGGLNLTQITRFPIDWLYSAAE